MAIDHDTVIEAFVVDRGFIDHSKLINEILTDETGQVAALTPKALSYFNAVSIFNDKRDPSTRVLNWSADTTPSIVCDEDIYSNFVSVTNEQSDINAGAIFKIVDYLLFNYDGTKTAQNREDDLLNDGDIADIYVPGSFEISNTLVEGTIYRTSGTTELVNVPAFTKFSITLPTGATTKTFVITVFASVDAWLTGYDISSIVKVIPPLPYSQIYESSITSSVDNIFSIGFLSANLSYNTTNATIGTVQVSGITSYLAVITDSAGNSASIPFNVLYKGRSPTLTEIRNAIRDDLLVSGVGTEAGWEARIPGVFVAGRFYIIPYWDLFYTKPNQKIFPSLVDYLTLGEKANRIMDSTGFGDIREHTEVFPVYYNRMTMAAVPDLTGLVDIQKLSSVIPDYQSYAPQDENFAYMDAKTQNFANQLNQILAIDTGAQNSSGIYTPVSENLLTFYSFVVEKYEVCVITKLCYTTIMESVS